MTLSFSYTMFDAFDQCPEKCRRLYVTRDIKQTYTVQSQGGVDTHKALEKRIKYQTPLPDSLLHAEPFVRSFETLGTVESEVLLGVDHNINPLHSWSAWLRGKFDVVVKSGVRAVYGDWKDGKVREKEDQLEIGALLILESDSKIQSVTGFNIWLKTGQVGPTLTVTREGKSARWLKWVQKSRQIESLNPQVVWDRRQSGLCPWCAVHDCPNFTGGKGR